MAEEPQLLADASEADTAARYARQQELAQLVAEAFRRAEAMSRLELSLRYGPVPFTAPDHAA